MFGLVPAKTPTKLNRAAAAKGRRNYAAEVEAAQDTLFDKAVSYGVQRKTGENIELTQIATALILCGLPYRKTDALKFSRISRAADGSYIRVTFHSVGQDADGNPVPLAYGADRTDLHWAVHQAIITKSSFVRLDSTKAFIKSLEQCKSGENYKRHRDAFDRLSSLSITVERFRDGDQTRTILPIIEHSHLPGSLQPGTTSINGPLGIRFGDAFFAEISKFHVPFPTALLRALSKKPQMQDYIVFLSWRSFAAKSTTIIPWDLMREQLWQEDSNRRRIRTRFAQAIALLKVTWPELNAEATARGLRIGPSSKYLFPTPPKESRSIVSSQ